MAEPARPGSWTGSVLVARLLRFGAAGAAITLVLEAREIWQQGYLALGWSYTVGRSLRSAALYGAAIGAVGALALGAIRDNLVASLPQLDDRLSMAALGGAPARRAGVSIALGLLAGVATMMEILVTRELITNAQLREVLSSVQKNFVNMGQPDSGAIIGLMMKTFGEQRELALSTPLIVSTSS